MGTSIHTTYNKQKVSKGNVATIYVRVTIDRKVWAIDTGVRWPIHRFDFKKGECLNRKPKDPDTADMNIMVRDTIGKANEILKVYRVARTPLDMRTFKREFRSDMNRDNFLEYMGKKIKNRKRNGEITALTAKSHNYTYHLLQEFDDILPFREFNESWAAKFDGFMVQKKLGINTRRSHHKNTKTYLRIAAKHDNLRFIDPYKNYKLKEGQGHWRPIYQEDITKLLSFYHNPFTSLHDKRVVRGFLFCCATGLRVSDLYKVSEAWVKDGMLNVVQTKNRVRAGKQYEIPMNSLAIELFNDALKDKRMGRLFNFYAVQQNNKRLHQIGQKLEIANKLHYHVGRHTFITQVIMLTHDLRAAKEWAGHSDIKDTLKYSHFDREHSKKTMEALNKMAK